MGDMADWDFDQMLDEQIDLDIELDYYLSLNQDELMLMVESILDNENYDHNEYTSMIVDIYMTKQKGYELSGKQVLAVSRHLVYQWTDNWY